MKISCVDAGKRFNRDWIFRHFNFEFSLPVTYAITGPNGSGKSTLLQVLSGAVIATTGKITYQLPSSTAPLEDDTVFNYLSIAAPYLEVVEEMTLTELLSFHQTFKPFIKGVTVNDIIQRVNLEKAADKQIRYFSSGMKQRVKLAQAIFSDTPCLFLDEPCTNFDESGFNLYHELMQAFGKNRLVIISSNDPHEYSFAENVISVLDYK
jgi:ABC-type multidrug transport system ATPase subunit